MWLHALALQAASWSSKQRSTLVRIAIELARCKFRDPLVDRAGFSFSIRWMTGHGQ
jgi:hypothetical protein